MTVSQREFPPPGLVAAPSLQILPEKFTERPPAILRQRITNWLYDAALPWWLDNTWDQAHGGVIEAFDLSGRDAALEFKRTRVICRQIYVFSHAHLMGWSDGLDLANRCADYMIDELWTGPQTGMPRLTTRDGAPLDLTIDLYDHAFEMFALAWHVRATNSAKSRDALYRTIDFIEARLRHPAQPGFYHQIPVEGWRRQNPHMHLTEASLAAFEATGDKRFSDLAQEMVALFQTRFFNRETGHLCEYFTDDLKPAPGEPGQIVEPGHQFEWSWILNALQPHLGVDLSRDIRALNTAAERLGVDPASGATRNSVRTNGDIIDGGSRTWPNTERLKSAVALVDLGDVSALEIVRSTATLLLDRYLAHSPAGTWIDAFNADGQPIATTIPTSTFYHVYLAFAEALRVLPEDE